MSTNPLFSTVVFSREGMEKNVAIREAFTRLTDSLEEILPGKSREISIIHTKLEEASFFAIKALRNYEGNRA